MRFRSSIPLAPPDVKITGYAPIEGRAKDAIGQRQLSHFVSAEQVGAAMGANLMNEIPNAMQGVADYEHNGQPETKNTEHSEYNHCSRFKSPRSLMTEVGGECEVKSRDCDQKQSKKDLLSSCREYFLRNENGSRCRQESDRSIQESLSLTVPYFLFSVMRFESWSQKFFALRSKVRGWK
jgi:hypothetical protein